MDLLDVIYRIHDMLHNNIYHVYISYYIIAKYYIYNIDTVYILSNVFIIYT